MYDQVRDGNDPIARNRYFFNPNLIDLIVISDNLSSLHEPRT